MRGRMDLFRSAGQVVRSDGNPYHRGMGLPRKIDDQVTQYFPGLLVGRQVRRMLKRLWHMNVTVGPDQLAEAILVLSGGQIDRVRALFASNFQGDPRDVLVAAEAALRRSPSKA
jgi:hypothetical protein